MVVIESHFSVDICLLLAFRKVKTLDELDKLCDYWQ